MTTLSRIILVLSFFLASTVQAADFGMAVHGSPKYSKSFKKWDYANDQAPVGGEVTLGWSIAFDTLNPFALKGISPLLMGSLVFQELGEQPLDEPFSQYPSVAESFSLAADKLSMTIKLNKKAKFSDGKPVTADDIVFTYELLTSDKVQPFYKFYWADVKSVTKTDTHTVVMKFAKENTELPLIATQMPVIPKHVYGKGDFNKDHNDTAIGSGPYVVKDYKRGSFITYERNKDFWGWGLPQFKGRYNFEKITIKFFKDATAQVEAFKKGDFDVYEVYSSKVWAQDLKGDKFDKKYISKSLWDHSNNQGSQGFMFNLRRDKFKDVRVRKAIALAFDFDWSNKNLFSGQYIENASFFENSPLKATGLPNAAELKVLEPLKADLPEGTLDQPMGYLGKERDIKKRLRTAMGLLKEAGYSVKDGVATGPAGKLEIDILLRGPGFQRIIEPYAQNLKRIGVILKPDIKEPSVYVKRIEARDFDMTVQTVGQSQSPGNEQLEFWGSKAADENFSRNYAGVKNKAIDALVNKIIYAKTREDLELYTKCLDRVLYHKHLVVHNWHSNAHRVAIWSKFGKPSKLPPYYSPRQLLEFMWFDQAKAGKLSAAQKSGKPLL